MSGPLFIQGVGLATAVGLGARAVAAATRAGVSRYAESELCNAAGWPYILALAPEEALTQLPRGAGRAERLLALAALAASEALAATRGRSSSPIPLVLSVPEPIHGVRAPIDLSFVERLSTALGVRFDSATTRIEPGGAAAGVRALDTAADVLATGRAEHVLVGGADSPFDAQLLEVLGSQGRLRVEGASDAFVPGEGAAFLLLSARPGRGVNVRAARPGVGRERGHRGSTEPHLCDGLAEAIRAALGPSGARPRSVLAGLNGESLLAREWGVAVIRNGARIDPEAPVSHPAECFGDLGAAMGTALVALASLEVAESEERGPCLVWVASEGDLRAAVVIDRAS